MTKYYIFPFTINTEFIYHHKPRSLELKIL